MKKLSKALAMIFVAAMLLSTSVFADMTYTVVSGDTMWKIAAKKQVGCSELIAANPQLKTPDLIYPGQVLTIPETDDAVRAYEREVVRLVNEIRVQYGLKELTENWELSRVARYKSQDMHDRGYFSHTSPTST